MNQAQVKDFFAGALSHPSPDRLNIDAAVRTGTRRRRRRRYGITASAVLMTLFAGLVIANMRSGRHVTASDPAPTAAIPAKAHVVTDARQIAGRWITMELYGRDVSGHHDADGLPLAVSFVKLPGTWSWVANNGCNNVSGSVTVTAVGIFRAVVEVTSTRPCPPSGPSAAENAKAVTDADHARIEFDSKGVAQLTLMVGDQVIGRYVRAA